MSDLLLGYQDWLRLGGAGFLLLVGVQAFTADPLTHSRSQRDPETLLADFAWTFALTLTNPITILAFLAIFAGIGFAGQRRDIGRSGDSGPRRVARLAPVVGRARPGAGMLRHSFRRNHLVWINRGSGGILMLSGVGLLGSVLVQYLG